MATSRAHRLLIGLVRLLCGAFFRRVDVVGLSNVPREGGGVLVAWHPNGMVDPGLILATCPGTVAFGARHGSFRVPLLGWLMRIIGTVPIYRLQDRSGLDPDARRRANLESLDALAGRVAAGSFSCLFPEGRSHDQPHPMELKTGAARFYYRARQLGSAGEPPPVILPVGLHYDAKREFRSKVLVVYHPPIELSAELDVTPEPDESADDARQRCRALTDEMDRVLRDVVMATETWETHHLIQRTRKLMRAERAHRAGADPARSEMRERTLGFARVWRGYYRRMSTHPARVTALRAKIDEYDADLRILGLEDHELDRGPRMGSPGRAALLVAQVVGVYLLLPPLLLVGYMVNLPVAIGLWVLSKIVAQKRKDEATVKLMFGALAFPFSWAAAGLLAGWAHHQVHVAFPAVVPDAPLTAALVVVALGAVGGAVALRYLRLVRETARAVRVRLTRTRRRQTLERLRHERGVLCDEVLALADGLALPGRVSADGTVDGEDWLAGDTA